MAASPLTRGIQAGARQLFESDSAREVLGVAVSEAIKATPRTRTKTRQISSNGSNGALSGLRGIAVGAGAAALAPIGAKALGKLIKGAQLVHAPKKALESAGSKLGGALSSGGDLKSGVGDLTSGVGDKLGGKVGGTVSAVKDALPGGSRQGGEQEASGFGKGRRMPVQQSVDVAVPLKTAYNQWTQFETWPTFMHRVTNVTQKDDCTVAFATRIWGKTKEFTARIETQRPDDRIKWSVSEGIIHTGVVTFHELGPRLTRIELALDVEPGGMLEKAARGMRHIKRAVRGDLHRFKAFIEMREEETGGWRGTIEDGKPKRQSSGNGTSARSRSGSGTKASSRSGSGTKASSRSGSGTNASSRSGSGTNASSRARSGSSRSAARSGSGTTRSASRGSSNSHGGRRRASGSRSSQK